MTMKTTVEIADSVFEEAKRLARSRRIPLRQLIEEGLRTVIEKDRHPQKEFRLRDGSFDGTGTAEDLAWPQIRERAYEVRGGDPSPSKPATP